MPRKSPKLLLVIVVILVITIFAPTLFDAVDPRVGSVVMVVIFLLAILVWFNKHRFR